jgi:hypothetical protein
MDLTKARKCSQFVDKAHAVGTVACLEDHFRRISKRLDDAGVPNDEVDPYTVEQRVAILIEAFTACGSNFFNGERMMTSYLREAVKKAPAEAEPVDPEDLNAVIDDEGRESITDCPDCVMPYPGACSVHS